MSAYFEMFNQPDAIQDDLETALRSYSAHLKEQLMKLTTCVLEGQL